LLHPREFLEHQLGLTLWLGQTVKAIRSEQKLLIVEEDNQSNNKKEATMAKSVEFAELVLSIGATSRRLQGVKEAENLEGILYMRTLADARHLAKEVVGKNVAIIGSGFLGFELASAIADTAGNVSIFGKATTPTTLLGTEVGNEIRKVHSKGNL
jgi:NADPH-dependent 2,4-dienoyl-CoA reductase/sulfur reductase-like enzyme